ncbi:MAG: hypothetical protein H6742_02260 [Alphaproteobacteria bacterium]|nr:hypothetical protein [Alphaproteobacteria bacterium]
MRLDEDVPGALRTDLHNSLWSLWYPVHALAQGTLPWHTDLLNPPDGGVLLVADPLGAVLAAPAVALLGLPVAYTLLVWFHLTLSGWAAHRFGEDLAAARGLPVLPAGLFAGVAYATAPVLRAAVHNGSSEAIAGGWAALAAWACWRAARHGGPRRAVIAGLALLLAALGSWYGAVVAFLFAGAFLVVGEPERWRATVGARVGALCLGLVLTAPVAAAVHGAATHPENLVRIKTEKQLSDVRRTTGAADIRGYFAVGDFRSPDFRELSRYGEGFFHCHALGWVVLAAALLSLRRRRGTGALWLAALAGLVLSLGPVLVRDGFAWIVQQDKAIPMPYLLLERLPGFSGLSLLYRLGQAPALGLALLGGIGVASLPRAALLSPLLAVAVLVDGRFLVPLGALPTAVDVRPPPAIVSLAAAPDGAVVNFPVVGGRAYLYEQTIHQKPMIGTLNFPNDRTGMRLWQAAVAAVRDSEGADGQVDLDRFREQVASRAEKLGVRYVAVHRDPFARPDMHDEAVAVIQRAFPALSAPADADVQVYALW